MSTTTGTCVDHLGHTSFAVMRGDFRILIDPVLVRRDMEFRQPTSPTWFFGPAIEFDAIIISHEHDDHLHPPTLLGFPEETPIYFFNDGTETTHTILSNLGFINLHPFCTGDTLNLPEEITVYIIPAEASAEGTEQCCFLIETPDLLMFDGVDSKDSFKTRQAMEQYRERLDLAFLPVGSSVQWQGFWNQMDPVHAASFAEWLHPCKVAPCGGSLSLAEKPKMGTIERYPNDFFDWLSVAGQYLKQDQLIRQRPPFRLRYEKKHLNSCAPFLPSSTYRPANGKRPIQAIVTTFFSGYDPHLPTRKLATRKYDLSAWLKSLEAASDIIRSSRAGIRTLIERCDLSVNRTPAATLLPSTLRCLVENRCFDLAADLSSYFPKSADGAAGADMGFFALAEALVENSPDLSEQLITDLRACIWIDQGIFQLQTVSNMQAAMPKVPSDLARQLVNQHIDDLRKTVHKRRPVLGIHHLRLDPYLTGLLNGKASSESQAGLLCYPSLSGVRYMPLSQLEAKLLDLCNGRRFPEIIEEISAGLRMPEAEVEEALFEFLSRLTRESILLIDWSL